MDIYIQPSRTDGFSKASLEAMSRGLPLITSDKVDMGYHTHPSLTHRVEDYETLAQMIKKLAEDKDFCREMTAFSFKTATEYSTAHFDEIFDRMCRNLVGGKKV